MHRYVLLILLVGASVNSALAGDSCPGSGLTPADMDEGRGYCRIDSISGAYNGSPVIGSAPAGFIFGRYSATYRQSCILPPNNNKSSNNYVIVALDATTSRVSVGSPYIFSNVAGIEFKAESVTLGGANGFVPLATIGDAYASNVTHKIEKTTDINGQAYFCGEFTSVNPNFMEVVRGSGGEPGKYQTRLKYVTGFYFTYGGFLMRAYIMNVNLPSVDIEMSAASCKLDGDNYKVSVNGGGAMSPKDFQYIATKFDIPLSCDAFEADVAYRLTPTNDIGRLKEGVFGLSLSPNVASGMAYQLSHIDRSGKSSLVDLSLPKQVLRKDDDSTSFQLPFSVSPIKIDSVVTPGEANASLTLEMIYE